MLLNSSNECCNLFLKVLWYKYLLNIKDLIFSFGPEFMQAIKATFNNTSGYFLFHLEVNVILLLVANTLYV